MSVFVTSESFRCWSSSKKLRYHLFIPTLLAILLPAVKRPLLVAILPVCYSSRMVFACVGRVRGDLSTPFLICCVSQYQFANIRNCHITLRRFCLFRRNWGTRPFMAAYMNLSLSTHCVCYSPQNLNEPCFSSKNDRSGTFLVSWLDDFFLERIMYRPCCELSSFRPCTGMGALNWMHIARIQLFSMSFCLDVATVSVPQVHEFGY